MTRNRALIWAALLLGRAGLVLQFTIPMPSRFRLPLARINALAVTTSPAASALCVIAVDKFLARTSRTIRQ